MKITGIDVLRCPIELPQAIRFGEVVIRARDYVVLRIKTDAGLEGYSVSYARGTPLLEALETLGRRILNAEPLLPRKIIHVLEQQFIPGRAAFIRAVSAIDIALWDIVAKTAKLPLFQLLGGWRTEVPLLAVAGYFPETRGIESLENEVKALVDDGYGLIKVCLPGADAAVDARLVTRLVKAAGTARLAVDAHWLWEETNPAWQACRRLDDLDLEFIEDPFPPHLWRLTAELAGKLATPLAAGEDVLGLAGFRDLLEGVEILRVDATASGGITGALGALQLAAAGGKKVLPHVFLPLHAQLAASNPQVSLAELTTDRRIDPYENLLRQPLDVKAGKMILSAQPGNGWDVDWQKAAALATEALTI